MRTPLVERARRGDDVAFGELVDARRRPLLRDRVSDPARCRGGPGRRPAGLPAGLARPPATAGRRALRRLAPSPARERLLRGIPPPSTVVGSDPGAAGRRTGRPRPDGLGRRPRPHRARVRASSPPSTVRSSSCTTTRACRSPTIAEVVGVPVGTVKSRLHHATRSLRAAIAVDSTLEIRGDLGRHERTARPRRRSWPRGWMTARSPPVLDPPCDLDRRPDDAPGAAGLARPAAWRPTMSKFFVLAGAAAVRRGRGRRPRHLHAPATGQCRRARRARRPHRRLRARRPRRRRRPRASPVVSPVAPRRPAGAHRVLAGHRRRAATSSSSPPTAAARRRSSRCPARTSSRPGRATTRGSRGPPRTGSGSPTPTERAGASLTDQETRDHNPEWSPDGSLIVFGSSRDGDFELYTQHVDGGAPTGLTSNEVDDDEPSWSPVNEPDRVRVDARRGPRHLDDGPGRRGADPADRRRGRGRRSGLVARRDEDRVRQRPAAGPLSST